MSGTPYVLQMRAMDATSSVLSAAITASGGAGTECPSPRECRSRIALLTFSLSPKRPDNSARTRATDAEGGTVAVMAVSARQPACADVFEQTVRSRFDEIEYCF